MAVSFRFLFALFFISTQGAADSCEEWFKKAKIAPGQQCIAQCATLPIGMDSFSCPSHCVELCGTKPKCAAGEHWVEAHHLNGYHGCGKHHPPSDIKAHCKKNDRDYDKWHAKFREGRPESWRLQAEVTAQWTAEERDRVLRALAETSELLKNQKVVGIYRMHKAMDPLNPSSSHADDTVLYDNAFSEEYNLAEVLGHELAHRLYDSLTPAEKKEFAITGKWNTEYGKPGRPECQFVRKNGTLSSEEDFADDAAFFGLHPNKLKKLAPDIYGWMNKKFGTSLKGGRCE